MSAQDNSKRTISEPLGQGVTVNFEIERVIVEGETTFQEYIVADTRAYGRVLFLHHLIQSAEIDECLYHEPLIHPGAIVHGALKRVLVAGAGEGATMRELLKYPSIEKIVCVDLDGEIIDVVREHLRPWHEGSFDDPRVEVRIEDAQKTIRESKDGEWDMIVLDISDPVEEGPSVDLFTVRFYREVARALADDGIITMQCGELDPADMRICQTVRTTLLEVFPWVEFMQTYVPSFHSLWGLAMVAKQPKELVPADLEQRVAGIEGPLKVYDANTHRALLNLPKFMREQLERPGKVMTGEGSERLITYDVRKSGILGNEG